MKTWRDNGERWYCDDRSLWKRLRQWAVWVGGWEKANGKGWDLFLRVPGCRPRLASPTPVRIFGGLATYYGWGFQIRLKQGYFVVSWRGEKGAYISDNGTPSRAHHWLWHPPREVLVASGSLVPDGDTTSDTPQTPGAPDDSAPFARA